MFQRLAAPLSLLVFLLSTSCSTSEIKVESQPSDSKVYIMGEGRKKIEIGRTPVDLDLERFRRDGSKNLQLQIEHEGYYSQSVLIPPHALPSKTRVYLALEQHEVSSESHSGIDSMRTLTSGIARAQRLIYSNKLDEAEDLLTSITVRFPDSNVAFDLLGNVYYVKREMLKAYQAYENSRKIWPNNPDTVLMITKLRAIVQNRLPASQEQY